MLGLNKFFQWNLVLVIGWFEEMENEQQVGNLAKNCACCVNGIVSNVLICIIICKGYPTFSASPH